MRYKCAFVLKTVQDLDIVTMDIGQLVGNRLSTSAISNDP